MRSRIVLQGALVGLLLLTVIGYAWHRHRSAPSGFWSPVRVTHFAGNRPEIVVGFVGDSITKLIPEGGGESPAEAFGYLLHTRTGQAVTIVNAGVPGYTTHQLLTDLSYQQTLLKAFQSARASVVMICTGTNDCRPQFATSRESHQSDIAALSAEMQQQGYRVVVNRPIWFRADHLKGCAEDTTGCAARFASYTDRWNGDTDAYAYFKAHPEELIDGVHPNRKGVENLASFWLKAYTRRF